MSAVHSLNKALDEVISGAGHKYHAGTVPPTVVPPYVVSMDDSEFPRRAFGSDGADTTINLHLWADTKMAVLSLYQALYALLNLTDIDVAGAELVRGRLRLVGTLQDPPTGLFHSVAEYRAETLS